MTEQRRAALQNWLNALRKHAHSIDTPSLTEENVARAMHDLFKALEEPPPPRRARPKQPDAGGES